MATYVTSKCPYCKQTLKFRKMTYWNDFERNIGNPIAYCPHCQRPYKTGKKWWFEMRKEEKTTIYLKAIVTILYSPFVYFAILGLLFVLVCKIFKWDSAIEYMETPTWIWGIIIFILFIYSMWSTLRCLVKLIEDSYDDYENKVRMLKSIYRTKEYNQEKDLNENDRKND